eukprot:scaffold88953_cov63-Phaeocystis_antarctica.AAC.4
MPCPHGRRCKTSARTAAAKASLRARAAAAALKYRTAARRAAAKASDLRARAAAQQVQGVRRSGARRALYYHPTLQYALERSLASNGTSTGSLQPTSAMTSSGYPP